MDKQKSLVSIGLPTYNRASLLREALDSLLNQTYPNFELVISDNASTDNTQKICEEYADKDNRIRYIRQNENIGMKNNFCFVLKEAKGEYFMWAADDDLWDKDYINSIIHEYENISSTEQIGFIATRWRIQDYNTQSKGVTKNKEIEHCKVTELTFKDFLKNACFNAVYIYGIYNRKILMSIQIEETTNYPVAFADLFILLRLLCVSKAKIIEKELFFYHQKIPPFISQLQQEKSMMRKITIISNRLILFLKNTLSNLSFSKLSYLFNRIGFYYRFNNNLIQIYFKDDVISLWMVNIISSIKLFFLLFLCDVRILKERDQKLFG